jgi:pilus assembly protein CpaB
MKKLLKNRTLIGASCIFLSLVICFGLTPLFNNAMTAQTEIARVKGEIKKGQLITPDQLETVTVGAYNLPSNVLKKTEEITGKYALADLQKGDYVLSTKLSATPLAEFEYLSNLDGSKQAMSVTIKSFAAGLSGKLEAGDIVTLIAADYGDRRETTMPPELQYMYVLAVTTEKGLDKEYTDDTNSEDNERDLPSTLTVLVCPEQAELLADLENKGKIHVTLVYRGVKEQAQKFLDVQDKYIAGLQKGNDPLIEGTTVPETQVLPNEAQGGNAQ